MRAVARFLFVIPLGFIAACYGGAFALLWPFLDLTADTLSNPFEIVQLLILFTAQAAQVGSVVLVPWAILMIVSELAGLSSLILHAAVGLVGGFTVSRLAYEGASPPLSIKTAIIVSGLGFALVYWLVAGRGAGNWRQPRDTA